MHFQYFNEIAIVYYYSPSGSTSIGDGMRSIECSLVYAVTRNNIYSTAHYEILKMYQLFYYCVQQLSVDDHFNKPGTLDLDPDRHQNLSDSK